jgi:hypothetical protein
LLPARICEAKSSGRLKVIDAICRDYNKSLDETPTALSFGLSILAGSLSGCRVANGRRRS